MSLAKKIAAISPTLARFQLDYSRGRGHRAALTPYLTPADVIAALDPKSPHSPAERYGLIKVLTDAHQCSPTSPVWGSILTVAFAPMLLRFRKRLGRPEDEDKDQRVLIAFLDAIYNVDVWAVGAFTTVAIQRATSRALVSDQIDEVNEPTFVPFDEDAHTPYAAGGLTVAEILVDLAWAARREERALASRRQPRATVHAFPAKRRTAA